MDKPTKPSNLIPRSFGGVKNNFSSSLQSSGYEDGVPAIYGGDNLNYQLDATGKELDYCEKICDYINAIPIGKTPIVDANNKLVYTQYDIRVYSANETYYIGDYVTGIVDNVKHIYQSLKDNNIGQSLSNQTYWKKVDIISDIQTIGRNIGEIVTSTIPLTDAGLHLLDGALISGSGIYSDFVTYISGLVSNYPDLFISESDWQTSVTTYGVCGKFVYDSTNNTVRLPKITGIIEGTTDLTALGDLIEAGLPNVSGYVTAPVNSTSSSSSPIYASEKSGDYFDRGGGGGYAQAGRINISLSRGNSIYGNSSTVQPQTIKVLYYIVVATTTKTEIEVDIDEIATDLNGKADRDGSNMVSSVKNFDGQWVHSLLEVSTATSVGSRTHDLSNYLPDTTNKYEVFVDIQLRTTTNDSYCAVGTAPNPSSSTRDGFTIKTRVSSNSRFGFVCGILPVSGATIYSEISTDTPNTGCSINLYGYRRIGTNS